MPVRRAVVTAFEQVEHVVKRATTPVAGVMMTRRVADLHVSTSRSVHSGCAELGQRHRTARPRYVSLLPCTQTIVILYYATEATHTQYSHTQ